MSEEPIKKKRYIQPFTHIWRLVEPTNGNIHDFFKLLPFGHTSTGKQVVRPQDMMGKPSSWVRKVFVKDLAEKIRYLLYQVRKLAKFGSEKVKENRMLRRKLKGKGFITKKDAKALCLTYHTSKMRKYQAQKHYLHTVMGYPIFEAWLKKCKFDKVEAMLIILISQYEWFVVEDAKDWYMGITQIKRRIGILVESGFLEKRMGGPRRITYHVTDKSKNWLLRYSIFYGQQMKKIKPVLSNKKQNVTNYAKTLIPSSK